MSDSGPDIAARPTELSNPDEWVEQHGNVMFAYALKYVGNRSTAEDLVQEALLGAFRGRHTFSGASAERTWLIGILKNKVMDYFRHSGRETAIADLQPLSGDTDPDFIASGPDAGQWKSNRRPAAWSVDSDDPVEQKQFWEQLQRCLEQIDDRLAEVYRLRDVQDMDYREACNVLSVKPTNLRVMLHRARKLLRSCLETNWIGA